MDFYRRIISCENDEVQQLLDDRIQELIGVGKKINFDNRGIIGYCLPKPFILDVDSDYDEIICYWRGYIPKRTKIIYDMDLDNSDNYLDTSKYFVVDTDEYIYEFIKYLREESPAFDNPFEIIKYLDIFLKDYFGEDKNGIFSWDNFNKLLVDQNGHYFNSSKEQVLSDIKGLGIAGCVEYSLLAANVLSVFGFNTTYIFGEINGEGHAYLLISYKNDDYYLLDFSMNADVYSLDSNIIRGVPYFQNTGLTKDEFNKFLNGNLALELDEYYCIKTGNELHRVTQKSNKKRIYSIDGKDYKELKSQPKTIVISKN